MSSRDDEHHDFLDTTEGVWFTSFDPKRHVSLEAEYDPVFYVRCAIDAGTSRHTAAVFFQVRHSPGSDRKRVTVFGDYHALDVVSQKNARAIRLLADQLPCRGRIDMVRLDPAASARSSLGPAAYSEYEREFGSRFTARWPQHLVLDGLDTIENLLETGDLKIHPRCKHLKDAFLNYQRQRRGGQWIDFPADGHPEEDLMDARSRRHSRCDAAGPGAGAEAPSGPCAGDHVIGSNPVNVAPETADGAIVAGQTPNSCLANQIGNGCPRKSAKKAPFVAAVGRGRGEAGDDPPPCGRSPHLSRPLERRLVSGSTRCRRVLLFTLARGTLLWSWARWVSLERLPRSDLSARAAGRLCRSRDDRRFDDHCCVRRLLSLAGGPDIRVESVFAPRVRSLCRGPSRPTGDLRATTGRLRARAPEERAGFGRGRDRFRRWGCRERA